MPPLRRDIALPGRIGPAAKPPGALPAVVIVGRPNVGKSSLLNCLARRRIAIVDPTAGVTRDRIAATIRHGEGAFELWDTGGVGTPDDLAAEVEAQIELALGRADLILFVVDSHQGRLPLDEEIAARLRRLERPIVLVVNKVEHRKHENLAAEFHALGFDKPVYISAVENVGRTDLLDEIVRRLPGLGAEAAAPELKLAIVGRQNVGKSTLINTLANEKRVIVSELPGTTRDAVDVRFERDGRSFMAVDTAGVKRKSRLSDSVEFYALTRAIKAIRRADVVLFLVDISADLSRVDKQLASAIEAECKPCILVVNKWDLVKDRFTTEEYTRYLNDHLHGLMYAPVSFICAQTGENLSATLDLARELAAQARGQVTTGQLNTALQQTESQRSAEAKHGKRPRLFYATQTAVAPPTFLIFASYPQLISDAYKRYLAGALRRRLPFPEIPIKLEFRARSRGSDKKPVGG